MSFSHTNCKQESRKDVTDLQERKKKYRRFLLYCLAGSMVSLLVLLYGTVKENIPDELFVYADSRMDWDSFFEHPLITYEEAVETAGKGSYQIKCSWMGIPLKTVKVHTLEEKEVFISGSPVGIYMETEGVLVIESGEITDQDGVLRTPAEHIVQPGDYICQVDGKDITGKKELIQLVKENQGEPMELQVLRHQEKILLELTPVQTQEGSYKLGIWVRDNIQGIGTLTYVDEQGKFGALGHGISDVDTGERLEISGGDLYCAEILSVQKSFAGSPGELKGVINYKEENRIGKISGNSLYGISGTLNHTKNIEELEQFPIGLKQEIVKGKAMIRCDVGDGIQDYESEILEIDTNAKDTNKCFEIRVTDERLLEQTGGIVQGMSGSPILQDGKIVGAVTHVLVNDPTRGYGIFIENMLEAEE